MSGDGPLSTNADLLSESQIEQHMLEPKGDVTGKHLRSRSQAKPTNLRKEVKIKKVGVVSGEQTQ